MMSKDNELRTINEIKWDNFKRELAKFIYPPIFEQNDYKGVHLNSMELQLKEQVELNAKLRQDLLDLNNELIKEKTKENELEEYCSINFKEVPKFAYKDKRKFNGISYAVYPNELIQPDKFLVEQVRKGIEKSDDPKRWIKNVGDEVDNRLKWTGDKETENVADYYSSPVESLLDKNKDCEDHSFLAASIEPKMGVAFGFAGDSGHAWNVFILNGELWCLETNTVYDYNRSVRVFKYKDQTRYKIHWIFTKDKTYQCRSRPTHFGYKAK